MSNISGSAKRVAAKVARIVKVFARPSEDYPLCSICCRDIGSNAPYRRIRMFRDPKGSCAIGGNQTDARRWQMGR